MSSVELLARAFVLAFSFLGAAAILLLTLWLLASVFVAIRRRWFS